MHHDDSPYITILYSVYGVPFGINVQKSVLFFLNVHIRESMRHLDLTFRFKSKV